MGEPQTPARRGGDIFPCTGALLVKPLDPPVLPEQASSCSVLPTRRGVWKGQGGSVPGQTVPNMGLHLTASSVRSCVAPASGSR